MDQLAALERRHTLPATTFECAARGSDRRVDVGRIACRCPGDWLAGSGIEHIEVLPDLASTQLSPISSCNGLAMN
jgi:hypothetical protein